jgi:hypothetical protein
MDVRQVIQLAKEWVELHGQQMPGFCGAYLTGGINTMPPHVPFPSYRDVDVIIVLEQGGKGSQENVELEYKSLILECGFKSLAEYKSPQSVLANPHLAPNLVVDSILSDPTGLLTRTHQVVAKEFARRRWVVARSDYEKNRTLGHLEQLRQAGSPFEVLTQLWWFANFLSGLIAVASLETPTHRKALVLMKELLQRQDRLAVHEELLSVLGLADLSRERVVSYLQECAAAFDRAVAVKRTPFPWDVKLHPHVRPYAIEGTQEMINEGYHREAVYWIELFWALSLLAIQNDAPEEEKLRFQAAFGRFLGDLGLRTPTDWQFRHEKAKKLTEDAFTVADEIVDSHPNIVD